MKRFIIEKREGAGTLYLLEGVTGYENCFVITVCDERDFACGSIVCEPERARLLFCELAQSNTLPYAVVDILRDEQLNKV